MRVMGRELLCGVLAILGGSTCGAREASEGSSGESAATETAATAGETAADTSIGGATSETGAATSENGSESTATTGGGSMEISLDDLQSWTRVDGPVLRDYEKQFNYEVASDIHVFRDEDGGLHAVYTGPNPAEDVSSIKLASTAEHTAWEPGQVVLSSAASPMPQLHKETAFYRRADAGQHQIFYIGYADQTVYQSQIFLAEADELVGPYTPIGAPVVAGGEQAGNDVFTITSPSIVEHLGVLYMVYCAWDAFTEVTIVWVHGATSEDDGKTWSIVGEVDVPVCMEGSFTRGPDGKFYAVATTEEGFTLGRSDEPFGPYTMLPEPALTPAGLPWEKEIVAPQILFEPGRAYLYYTGVDEAVGWWTMLAFTDLN